MIKFVVMTTQFCNFCVLRMEVEPVYYGSVLHSWKVMSDRRKLPVHSFGYLPGTVATNQVFDTIEEAETSAKSRADDLKAKFIKEYTHKAEYARKRLEAMMDHQPKVRRINLVK